MAEKAKQLSLQPFFGNVYTVYVVQNHWGPIWHVQDRHGHTVNYPHQPSFETQQAAYDWAADLGYKVEIGAQGSMCHLSRLLSCQ